MLTGLHFLGGFPHHTVLAENGQNAEEADDVGAMIGSGRLRRMLQVLHELAAAVPGAQRGHQHLPGHRSNSPQHSGGQCMWFHDAHVHPHAGRLCPAPGADPRLVDLGLLDWYTSCDVCLYVCMCVLGHVCFSLSCLWLVSFGQILLSLP